MTGVLRCEGTDMTTECGWMNLEFADFFHGCLYSIPICISSYIKLFTFPSYQFSPFTFLFYTFILITNCPTRFPGTLHQLWTGQLSGRWTLMTSSLSVWSKTLNSVPQPRSSCSTHSSRLFPTILRR